MKNSRWVLFFIALVMIGATGGFLSRLKGNQKLGEPGVLLGNAPLFDEQTNRVAETTVILPENIPGFTSKPSPITAIELQALPKDTLFGKRRYAGTNTSENVDVSVVLMGQDRTSIHKPQICLIAQGWKIESQEIVKIKMDRPHPYDLSVMKMISSITLKDNNGNPATIHGLYVYWFVADNKLTARHEDRMVSMAKTLLRTGVMERWAYISYFSRCWPGEEEKTFDYLTKFIATTAPEFQLAVGNRNAELQTAFK